jgi:hypothetical protein
MHTKTVDVLCLCWINVCTSLVSAPKLLRYFPRKRLNCLFKLTWTAQGLVCKLPRCVLLISYKHENNFWWLNCGGPNGCTSSEVVVNCLTSRTVCLSVLQKVWQLGDCTITLCNTRGKNKSKWKMLYHELSTHSIVYSQVQLYQLIAGWWRQKRAGA